MDVLAGVNWWAVIVAAIVYFILGGLWYSLLFRNLWMQLRNITQDDIGEPNPMLFVWTFVLQVITIFSLATFITAMQVDGALGGAVIGFGAGAGLVFTTAGTTGLFSYTSLGLHLVDNGYHVVGLTIAGLIIGWW